MRKQTNHCGKQETRSGSEGERALWLLQGSHNNLQSRSHPQSHWTSIPTWTLPLSPCLCPFCSLWIEYLLLPTKAAGPSSPKPTYHMTQFKGPSSMKPSLNSSPGSNLSYKVLKTICTSLETYPFLQGTIFIFTHIYNLFGPLNTYVLQRSLLDPFSRQSTLCPHKHEHTHVSLPRPSPHCFTISYFCEHELQNLYSNLQSYGSLKFQSLISDCLLDFCTTLPL